MSKKLSIPICKFSFARPDMHSLTYVLRELTGVRAIYGVFSLCAAIWESRIFMGHYGDIRLQSVYTAPLCDQFTSQ